MPALATFDPDILVYVFTLATSADVKLSSNSINVGCTLLTYVAVPSPRSAAKLLTIPTVDSRNT